MASDCLTGLKGTYRLGSEIGHGGNGSVNNAIIVSSSIPNMTNGEFAIKCFNNIQNGERLVRFKNEIEFVEEYYGIIDGIIPIFDHHLPSENSNYWYLMPKAVEYEYNNKSFSDFLTDMILLGETIKRIHDSGFEHRDIKPANIMFFNGRISLTDFGLVYDDNNDNNLTRFEEGIGALSTRPPELEPYRDKRGVDFKKSDVYMFAKTIWIYITKKKYGFPGEYSRGRDDVYLRNNKRTCLRTTEPLHRMMEAATKTAWEDRISITECLWLLHEQKEIEDETAPEETVSRYIAQEKLLKARTVDPEIVIYKQILEVSKVLKVLEGHCSTVYLKDIDKTEYSIGYLDSFSDINGGNDYLLAFYGSASLVKSLVFHVDKLVLSKEAFSITTGMLNDSTNYKGIECKSPREFFHAKSPDRVLNGVFEIVFR